ncbi:MAG: hypothetical protein ABI462_03045 [Ignavibacteria bacterium]
MKKSILLLLIISVIYLGSCGNKNETSGDKKEDSKQEVKKENDQTALKNEELSKKESTDTDPADDKSKSNELGMTPGMPADFPKDVPTPNNAKTLGSLNSSEGTIVTFESNDKVMDIVTFYKDEMGKNGYTISEGGESLISDKGGLINWKKDKKEVGLMLGYDKDKNITSLVITYK